MLSNAVASKANLNWGARLIKILTRKKSFNFVKKVGRGGLSKYANKWVVFVCNNNDINNDKNQWPSRLLWIENIILQLIEGRTRWSVWFILKMNLCNVQRSTDVMFREGKLKCLTSCLNKRQKLSCSPGKCFIDTWRTLTYSQVQRQSRDAVARIPLCT